MVVAILALLGIAFIGGNIIAGQRVQAETTSSLQQKLDLDSAPEVSLGGPPILVQLMLGRLDDVSARADGVKIGDVTGDLTVEARGVPVSGQGALSSGSVTLKVSSGELQRLIQAGSPVPLDAVAFDDGTITVVTSLSFLGAKFPLKLAVEPAVDGTTLVLKPSALSISGFAATADELQQQFGDAASFVTGGIRVCLADRIPAGVQPQSIAVDPTGVTLDASLDPNLLDDPALQKTGTC